MHFPSTRKPNVVANIYTHDHLLIGGKRYVVDFTRNDVCVLHALPNCEAFVLRNGAKGGEFVLINLSTDVKTSVTIDTVEELV
jgi:hypothetical protein